MLARRNQNARLQSDFYRDQFYRMIRWLMACLLIIVLIVMAIIYTLFTQPSNRYYANTPEGQILSMPNPSVLSTASQ